MLYRVREATAHSDHTVSITWSDGVQAVVDLMPAIAKGKVFAPLRDPKFFVDQMRVADDHLGIEWPNRVDFSADGLRFRAFPNEAEEEFGGAASTDRTTSHAAK
jgi:hypothetical protein